MSLLANQGLHSCFLTSRLCTPQLLIEPQNANIMSAVAQKSERFANRPYRPYRPYRKRPSPPNPSSNSGGGGDSLEHRVSFL